MTDHPKTEIEKADLLRERSVGGATETATIITEELGKRFDVGLDGDAARNSSLKS